MTLKTWSVRLMAYGMAMVFSVAVGCKRTDTQKAPQASGYVEATEVHVASKLGGRVLSVNAVEGHHVAAGETLVTLSTTDADLALQRARADRAQADAQLRLLRAGSRPEDIEQAQAQVAAAESPPATSGEHRWRHCARMRARKSSAMTPSRAENWPKRASRRRRIASTPRRRRAIA